MVLNTLHDPIEVQVGETVLTFRPITLGGLAKLEKLDTEAASLAEFRDVLAGMIQGDATVLDDLPLAEVHTVVGFLIRASLGLAEPGPEKNGSGPGPT